MGVTAVGGLCAFELLRPSVHLRNIHCPEGVYLRRPILLDNVRYLLLHRRHPFSTSRDRLQYLKSLLIIIDACYMRMLRDGISVNLNVFEISVSPILKPCI